MKSKWKSESESQNSKHSTKRKEILHLLTHETQRKDAELKAKKNVQAKQFSKLLTNNKLSDKTRFIRVSGFSATTAVTTVTVISETYLRLGVPVKQSGNKIPSR